MNKCSINLILLVLAILSGYNAHSEEILPVTVPPINQQPSTKQIPGKIIWHDLFTDNVDEAQRFYGDVFGWHFQTFGTGKDSYTLISHQGKRIGGIVRLTEAQAAQNENQWISYISVSNVAQVASYVNNNAGEVLLSPRRFEHQGDLAIFSDPEGAAFGVLMSASGDPADAKSEVGEWAWADLLAKNPQQQILFYQGIANYDAQEDTRDPQANDYFLYLDKLARAGVVSIPASEAATSVQPNWLPYLRVANVNKTVTKVTQLGGSVIFKPNTQVFNSKLAIIADPGGAAVGIVELDK